MVKMLMVQELPKQQGLLKGVRCMGPSGSALRLPYEGGGAGGAAGSQIWWPRDKQPAEVASMWHPANWALRASGDIAVKLPLGFFSIDTLGNICMSNELLQLKWTHLFLMKDTSQSHRNFTGFWKLILWCLQKDSKQSQQLQAKIFLVWLTCGSKPKWPIGGVML